MSPNLSLDCNPCPDRHDIRHHTPLEPQHTLHFALSAMALPKGMTPTEMRALVEPNLAHLPVITFDDVARQVDLLNHQTLYENEFIGQVGKVYHRISQVCRIFLPGTRVQTANNYRNRDRQSNSASTRYTYNSR